MEINYSSTLEASWLEHIAILKTETEIKSLLSYAALQGLELTLINARLRKY